jgi:hypothetical protein
MSEHVENLIHLGLPAAVLQALVPRSASLAPPPEPKHKAPRDVDRFTSGQVTVEPEPVVTELRGMAELHQAQQAARLPEAA